MFLNDNQKKGWLFVLLMMITSLILLGIPQHSKSSGTGTVISDDGYIITNKHVVTSHDGKHFHRYMLFISKGKHIIPAWFVTASKTRDIAILKLAIPLKTCSPISTGKTLRHGDQLDLGIFDFSKKDHYNIINKTPSLVPTSILKDDQMILGQRSFEFAPLVYPGNSGSSIFKHGEVVGLVFAGNFTETKNWVVPYAGFGIYLNDIKAFLADVAIYKGVKPICTNKAVNPIDTIGYLEAT